MKAREFKEMFEDVDDDAEVTVLIQPNYPIETRITGIAIKSQINEAAERDPDLHPDRTNNEDNHVYIVTDGDIGYGPKAAWDVAQWN